MARYGEMYKQLVEQLVPTSLHLPYPDLPLTLTLNLTLTLALTLTLTLTLKLTLTLPRWALGPLPALEEPAHHPTPNPTPNATPHGGGGVNYGTRHSGRHRGTVGAVSSHRVRPKAASVHGGK